MRGTTNPKKDIEHTHLGSIGNLGLKLIHEKMEKAMKS